MLLVKIVKITLNCRLNLNQVDLTRYSALASSQSEVNHFQFQTEWRAWLSAAKLLLVL